jgi:patatin-like phospholipase/acyl hydrolase
MLEQTRALVGIDGHNFWQLFQGGVIAGTSSGSFTALGLAAGMAPADLMKFYENDAQWIFSTSTSTPGVRATTVDKITTILAGGAFYDNPNLSNKLNDIFGTMRMSDLPVTVLVPSYNFVDTTSGSSVFFSNALYPGYIGQDWYVKDVALCSSAAPFYLPRASVGGLTYIDGAMTCNNPARSALALAQILKPASTRSCVMSIGTGNGDIGMSPTSISTLTDDEKALFSPADLSNAYLLLSLVEMCMSGNAEGVHFDLFQTANYANEGLAYIRENSSLDPSLDTEIDNSTTGFLSYLAALAVTQFNSDIDAMSIFLAKLVA